MPKIKLLFCLAILFLGKQPHFKGVTTFDCYSIDIRTSDKLPVHIDGKLAGTTNHISNTIYKDSIRMPK
jgi:diacylglycerol kinase family enzyme